LRNLSHGSGNCLSNILLRNLWLFVLLIEVRVAFHVKITKVFKFFDLSLKLIFLGEFCKHVIVSGDLAFLHQFFLFLDFVELFLKISQFLTFLGKEEIIKGREFELGFVRLLFRAFGLL